MHKKKYSSTKGKLFQTSLAALFRNDCTTDFVGKRNTTDLIDLDIRFHIIGLEEDTKVILLRSNLMMGRQRKFCLLVFKKDQTISVLENGYQDVQKLDLLCLTNEN